jgi:7-cyano-7-deazaguanine reductase
MSTLTNASTDAVTQSALGKHTVYLDQYDPGVLFALPRQTKRAELGLVATDVPFMGVDMWTAYELGWLNTKGKPQVAVAQVLVPAHSPCMIESKSLKLYFNGFNNTQFESAQQVQTLMEQDLTRTAWPDANGSVSVQLLQPQTWATQKMQPLQGDDLDRFDIECHHYTPCPELLHAHHSQAPVTQTLVSHLLRSNCLVTGQPDWGSVQIAYTGAPIDDAGLLQYIVSFRNHHEFHEQCVERIFMDIWRQCKPLKLSVYARYTRRGGIDINPWRTSHPQPMPTGVRTVRQ